MSCSETTEHIITRSPGATERAGEEYAARLEGGELILLLGELGSGKTTFVRGLARGLGVEDPDGVSSPSYVIATEYPGRIKLVHVDLYRLDAPISIEELALDELLSPSSVVIVEWGEKFPSIEFPAVAIQFSITGENSREIRLAK